MKLLIIKSILCYNYYFTTVEMYLEEYLSCIRGVLLQRTVWTLELVALGQLGQSILGDDVTTHHLHGRVGVSDLLSEDGTREYRVKSKTEKD